MSAFIVSKEVYQRVANYLSFALRSPYGAHSGIQHIFRVRQLTDDMQVLQMTYQQQDEASMKFVNDLIRINFAAVNYRYEVNKELDKSDLIRTVGFTDLSYIQFLKYLDCIHYQCSEGNIPETSDTYKTLELIINATANGIVSELEEYKNAEWA